MDEFLRSTMSRDISEIPGLSGKTLVLFRASGFVNVGSLVDKSATEIERVLSTTNGEYGIVGWLPSPNAVKAWIATARLLENAGTDEESGPMSEDALAEVRESAVMIARPVLGAELMGAGVTLEAIPIAKFVGDAPQARPKIASVTHIRMGVRKRRSKQSDQIEGAEGATGLPADLEGEEGSQPFEEAMVPEERESSHSSEEVAPRQSAPDEEDTYLQFRDTESLALLNKSTERRNHGMTHKDPTQAWMSAVVTLVTLGTAWVAGLICIGLAVYFAMTTGEMPKWLLYFLPVVPICLFLYGTLGLRARCRLCGYGLFVHKTCRKHEKAHHSILGSIFATALRVVIRGTWRCMYCGTKQKLK